MLPGLAEQRLLVDRRHPAALEDDPAVDHRQRDRLPCVAVDELPAHVVQRREGQCVQVEQRQVRDARLLDRAEVIGAAEWLIKNKYTNPSKLAISGGSNGGLLVGAAMTQRPELFQRGGVLLSAAGHDSLSEFSGCAGFGCQSMGRRKMLSSSNILRILALPSGEEGREISGGVVRDWRRGHKSRSAARAQDDGAYASVDGIPDVRCCCTTTRRRVIRAGCR